jgi:hypothetical protein
MYVRKIILCQSICRGDFLGLFKEKMIRVKDGEESMITSCGLFRYRRWHENRRTNDVCLEVIAVFQGSSDYKAVDNIVEEEKSALGN